MFSRTGVSGRDLVGNLQRASCRRRPKGRSGRRRVTAVAVTGAFCSGKTTVARMFESLGARRIDADEIARRVLRKGSPAYREVAAVFGSAVLGEDGSIDRKALALRVFSPRGGARRRKQLEGIVHPRVARALGRALAGSAGRRDLKAVVVEVPLLYEAGMEALFDRVVAVTAPRDRVLEWAEARRGTSRSEAKRILAAQWDASWKAAKADFVIRNTGDPGRMLARVKAIWKEL